MVAASYQGDEENQQEEKNYSKQYQQTIGTYGSKSDFRAIFDARKNVIYSMNRLSLSKRTEVIAHLVEGNSVNPQGSKNFLQALLPSPE